MGTRLERIAKEVGFDASKFTDGELKKALQLIAGWRDSADALRADGKRSILDAGAPQTASVLDHADR